MTMVKHNPRNSMRLYDDFDKILGSFFNTSAATPKVRLPSVDIREDETGYYLEAELPGLNETDVDVQVEENLLTISSKQKEEKEEKKDRYIMKERSEREFRRSFVLPRDADNSAIEARFTSGLLTLAIPKLPETKPRQIQVKS